MSFRSKRRHELDALVNNQQLNDASDEEIDEGVKISFQSGEIPLILKDGLAFYSPGKCDYSESLIGSKLYWHQIIVSEK